MPWTDYLIGRSPAQRVQAAESRRLMTPTPTRMGFTQQEIEQNPELQRMRMTPIEMRGFRGMLETRKGAERQEKLKMLYEKANATIDDMKLSPQMKDLLKASVFGSGPGKAIDFLEARISSKEQGDLEFLKAFLKSAGEETWEAPEAGAQPFAGKTVTQRSRKTGKVTVLQQPSQAQPKGAKTPEAQIKEASSMHRQWLSLEKSLEQGGLDNPLLATAISQLDPNSPFVQAFQGQDLSAMQDIARKARQYWEDEFEKARIKTAYPNARKDEYGWYVIKDGKKYDVVVD